MIAAASSSDSPWPKNAGDEPIPPKLPQPRMMRETRTPVLPSGVCSIRRPSGARSASLASSSFSRSTSSGVL